MMPEQKDDQPKTGRSSQGSHEPDPSAFFRPLLERTPVVIWSVDRDLRFTSGGGSGLEALGLEGPELTGVPLAAYFGTDDPDFPPIAAHRRALAGEKSEYPFTWEGRTYQTYVEPMLARDGSIVGAIGIAYDVTDAAKRTEQLVTTQRFFEQLVRSSPVVVIEGGATDGVITYVSPNVEALLGYPPHEILGRPGWFAQHVHVDDVHPALARLERALATRAPTASFEYRFRHRDGRYRWLFSMANFSYDDPSAPVVLTYAIDITEQVTAQREKQAMEEMLHQSQRLESVGRLAGGIAHDFNNLLAVILSYAELVLRRLPAEDPVRRDVEEIRRAADRGVSLVRQLLIFSRREIGTPEVLDIANVLADVESLLRRTIGEDVELHIDVSNDVAPVEMERTRLEQVLMNLAVNARDAMPEGGTLTIEATNHVILTSERQDALPTGSYVRIVVTDSGVGMTADVLARAFDPFFTTKPSGERSGLGLATTYGIVADARGTIDLSSEVGKGTRVEILLPASQREVPATTPAAQRQMPATKGETILVVEDEPEIRRVVARVLTGQGYRVLEATDGIEAMEKAQASDDRIDLVLTDVVMPRMSGKELAERLTLVHPEAKILFMSGYVSDTRGKRLTLPGPVLEKPFSIQGLLASVHDVLDDADAKQ